MRRAARVRGAAAALSGDFHSFLYGMLAIFLFAGIGNASTFKQMPMIFERRLLTRDRGAGILEKFWQIPWSFVLLLCAVAAVGYVALLSAGSGNPDTYAQKHAIRFGFGLGFAVTTDVARNLLRPVEEMGLGVRIETRTGDTPASKRQRRAAAACLEYKLCNEFC